MLSIPLPATSASHLVKCAVIMASQDEFHADLHILVSKKPKAVVVTSSKCF